VLSVIFPLIVKSPEDFLQEKRMNSENK
jgi:hypothetical protein